MMQKIMRLHLSGQMSLITGRRFFMSRPTAGKIKFNYSCVTMDGLRRITWTAVGKSGQKSDIEF